MEPPKDSKLTPEQKAQNILDLPRDQAAKVLTLAFTDFFHLQQQHQALQYLACKLVENVAKDSATSQQLRREVEYEMVTMQRTLLSFQQSLPNYKAHEKFPSQQIKDYLIKCGSWPAPQPPIEL